MFEEQIKRIRSRVQVSQDELARIIGVTVNTVARWERGEVRPGPTFLETINKYCYLSSPYYASVFKFGTYCEGNQNLSDIKSSYECFTSITCVEPEENKNKVVKVIAKISDKCKGKEISVISLKTKKFKLSQDGKDLWYENIQVLGNDEDEAHFYFIYR